MVPRLGMWLNFWANSRLAVLTRVVLTKKSVYFNYFFPFFIQMIIGTLEMKLELPDIFVQYRLYFRSR